MKRIRLVASIVTGLLIAVFVALVVIAVIGNVHASNKEAGLSRRLAQTQRSLAQTQVELEKTVKASADTRITTVTQRCNFTRLVTNVLVQQDPKVAPPFQKSLAGCLAQLAVVKQIAAAASSAPSTPTK